MAVKGRANGEKKRVRTMMALTRTQCWRPKIEVRLVSFVSTDMVPYIDIVSVGDFVVLGCTYSYRSKNLFLFQNHSECCIYIFHCINILFLSFN